MLCGWSICSSPVSIIFPSIPSFPSFPFFFVCSVLCFFSLKLQLQTELEITHRIGPEIGRSEDQAKRGIHIQLAARIKRAYGGNWTAEVDVIEDVDRFDAEL